MHQYKHLFFKDQAGTTIGYMLRFATSAEATDERLIEIWRSNSYTHIGDDTELRMVDQYARHLIDTVLNSVASITVESRIDRPDVIDYRDQQWFVAPQSSNLQDFKDSTPIYFSDVIQEVQLFPVTSRMIERHLNTEYLLSAVRGANRASK